MDFRLVGYSYESEEDARERMEEKARLHRALHERREAMSPAKYRERLRRLDAQPEQGEYRVVIAEEVAERVDENNVITRNRYGVLVLNSQDTCFLDVDHVPQSWWKRLLGMGSEEDELLKRARSLCAEDEALGLRVYRTARGWRVVAAAPGLQPGSEAMQHLCERLSVDALYRRLCGQQGCWRARLTPKPRRVGMGSVYPAPASSAQAAPGAAEWLGEYEQKTAGMAVCRLVDTFGRPVRSAIVELHDVRTCACKAEQPLR